MPELHALWCIAQRVNIRQHIPAFLGVVLAEEGRHITIEIPIGYYREPFQRGRSVRLPWISDGRHCIRQLGCLRAVSQSSWTVTWGTTFYVDRRASFEVRRRQRQPDLGVGGPRWRLACGRLVAGWGRDVFGQ